MIATLLHFNNYFDRVYKKTGKYLSDIRSAYIIHEQTKNDFNPNDGVNTVAIFNVPSEDEGKANYLVLSENNEIISRWFIIDSRRTRLNQYEVVLRRDLLADYFDDIVNAPSFIEKATVSYANPLLYNDEEMTFNQIKKSETALRDSTACSWIVGYINREVGATTITAPLKNQYVAEYASLQDIPYYTALSNGLRQGTNFGLQLGFQAGIFNGSQYIVAFDKSGLLYQQMYPAGDFAAIRTVSGPYYNSTGAASAYGPISAEGSQWIRTHSQFTSICEVTCGTTASSTINGFLKEYSVGGKIIKVGGRYYKAYRDTGNTRTVSYMVDEIDTDFLDLMDTMISDISVIEKKANDTYRCFEIRYTLTTYRLYLSEVSVTNRYNATITADRAHLNDAPYDMFAIPYNTDTTIAVRKDGSWEIAKCDYEASMAIASKIAETIGDRLYDLQLLPYCPMRAVLGTTTATHSIIDITNLTADVDYSFISKDLGATSRDVSIILWCQQSDFSFTIDKAYGSGESNIITIEDFDLAVDIPNAKIQALCDKHRLVSPNYNGQFEFNIVKNQGVEFFTVDATYKPYSPYIRVAPNFDGLYGQDFDDARGLICGGDFSLPTTTDQWKQYELNNKNYLNAFNRQIENMEVNNKYQRQSEVWGAVAGTVQGAASGATAGIITGNPYIAAGGAVAGGAISAAGGIADININDQLRKESLDYTRDQFGYQLGNIQALPYSLNRVSSFNINNKIFPILEYYSCTDIEKQALRNKIKYNGMTVMTIGTIATYITNEESYIKARIIRLPGLDNHTSNEIAAEFNKGFYISGEEINN